MHHLWWNACAMYFTSTEFNTTSTDTCGCLLSLQKTPLFNKTEYRNADCISLLKRTEITVTEEQRLTHLNLLHLSKSHFKNFECVSKTRSYVRLNENNCKFKSNYRPVSELVPEKYGLSQDGNQQHNLHGILNVGKETATTAEVLDLLENMYCNNIATEFQHCRVRYFICIEILTF